MRRLIEMVLERWALVALISSALMLAIAHAFEAAGYAPCLLCLRQREVYWVAGAVALAGAVAGLALKGRTWTALVAAVLGAIFLYGAGLAAFHAGVEWRFWPGPRACAGVGGGGVTAEDMAAMLSGGPVEMPGCDKPAWVFLGLSMAGWNALVSL
ncbi:MAG: disulfide bond formation protein B, partial [Phenylobacterium sp.]